MKVLKVSLILTHLSLLVLKIVDQSQGQTYSQAADVHKYLYETKNYTAAVRPLLNQSDTIHVQIWFSLLSIIDVNDVSQSFKCNGYLSLRWTDELLKWDPSDFGGMEYIIPLKEEIWKPRLMLWNTLENRDIFGKDDASVSVSYDGSIDWVPGSVFTVSCDLDMTNFPFDEQICAVKLIPMDHGQEKLRYNRSACDYCTTVYSPNGEWDLLKEDLDVVQEGQIESVIKVTFHVKRKAGAFLINVLIPVVILSFLNLLVFLIPADSGERIGYGITVSLALVLSMTFVSEKLPSSTKNPPKVTVYLFALLVLSFLTVIMSIIIVFLHHLEEKEIKHQRAAQKFQRAAKDLSNIRYVVTTLKNRNSDQGHEPDNQPEVTARSKDENNGLQKNRGNKYRKIGRYIDITSFVVFLLTWLGLTFGYILSMALS